MKEEVLAYEKEKGVGFRRKKGAGRVYLLMPKRVGPLGVGYIWLI